MGLSRFLQINYMDLTQIQIHYIKNKPRLYAMVGLICAEVHLVQSRQWPDVSTLLVIVYGFC